jgi:hypothetical protein
MRARGAPEEAGANQRRDVAGIDRDYGVNRRGAVHTPGRRAANPDRLCAEVTHWHVSQSPC